MAQSSTFPARAARAAWSSATPTGPIRWPALASHGGYATLVGVDEDNNVYVTMGGGCQGCSASAATLKDGIRSSIMEHIPEVAEVIDATDHAAGESPFYS